MENNIKIDRLIKSYIKENNLYGSIDSMEIVTLELTTGTFWVVK